MDFESNLQPGQNSFAVDYFDGVGFKCPKMHRHKFSELIFVINGNLNFLVEDEVYHSQDSCLIFLKEKQLHTTDVDENSRYTRYNAVFNYKGLSDSLDYNCVRELYESDNAVISLTDEEKNKLISLMEPISRLNTETDPSLLQLARHLFCALLIYVNQLVKKKSGNGEYLVDTYINEVLNYIKENPAEKLLIEDLARRFYISRSKLMGDFKKATGITIGDFILYTRINCAKELLMSGKSVNETAVQSGFVNASHFIRTFKRETGYTPLKYCRQKS